MSEYSSVTELAELCINKSLTLATIESCTGGLIAKLITDLPGSSDFYKGSIITYSNELKTVLADVSPTLISQYGAVSSEVAEAMVRGGSMKLSTDCCISVTGIAGPGGGSLSKPVGTVFIGLKHGRFVQIEQLSLKGDREEIRLQAAERALVRLIQFLKKNPDQY